MPLLPERSPRHVDTSRSPTVTSVEQFLRGGESSRMSPTYSPNSSSPSSPYFERLKHHDPEEDHALYQKKSVLTKVKEKARKLRHSLSKRRQEDGNLTPSWGVSLEDDEEEEDSEYLGAPMYESELAPDGYKENARQRPRANPVISEKHVLCSPVKSGMEQDLSPVKSTTTTQPETTPPPGPNMTEGSDAAHSISSKIQGLAVSRTPPDSISSQTSSSAPLTIQVSSSGDASETMSPRTGVLEKLKGAVNSLLLNEEPSQQYAIKVPTTRASSQAINSQEVGRGENHGGILQAN